MNRNREKICWACGAAAILALAALTAPRAVADDSDVDYAPPLPPEIQAQATGRSEIAERPWAGAEYFKQAKAAFRQAQFQNASGLASYAAIDDANNAKAHELRSSSMFATGDYDGAAREEHLAYIDDANNAQAHELRSLSMFATGDYSEAAREAHLALALGSPANWATLAGYYGNEEDYVKQLRSLEKFSQENPNSADAHFVRAYHYLMIGYVDSFRSELAEAAKLRPEDILAANLLKLYGEGATLATAFQPAKKTR